MDVSFPLSLSSELIVARIVVDTTPVEGDAFITADNKVLITSGGRRFVPANDAVAFLTADGEALITSDGEQFVPANNAVEFSTSDDETFITSNGKRFVPLVV